LYSSKYSKNAARQNSSPQNKRSASILAPDQEMGQVSQWLFPDGGDCSFVKVKKRCVKICIF
jgi:hypothetical protein